MKRRSFLGLLGLAPAVPVLAKELKDLTPLAPKALTPEVAEETVHIKTQSEWFSACTCGFSVGPSIDYPQWRK